MASVAPLVFLFFFLFMCFRRIKRPIVKKEPEDLVYTPYSLQDIVANHIVKSKELHKAGIFEWEEQVKDKVTENCISKVIQSATKIPRKLHCHTDIASKYSRQEITVAEFGKYHPEDQDESILKRFVSVDLKASAEEYLRLQREFAKRPEFYENLDLLITRYHHFLSLQHKHRDLNLFCPLDIKMIWLCHLIRNKGYIQDTTNIYNEVLPCRILDTSLPTLSEDETKILWEKKFPEIPFALDTKTKFVQIDRMNFTAFEVSHDRDWLVELESYISKTGNLDFTVLEKHYERYLYLVARYPKQNLAPPVSVDLIWHSHQCYPDLYISDCKKLLWQDLVHQPWPHNPKQYQSKCECFWKKEFVPTFPA